MGVIVNKQRVDTGKKVYFPGDVILGLSNKNEKELVDLGVCRYISEDLESDNNESSVSSKKADELPEGLKEVARGSFELPNGVKVKGKAKAIEALEAYNQDLIANENKDDDLDDKDDPDADGEGPKTDLPT